MVGSAKPGARDLAGAGGDAAVGQGVFRRLCFRRPIDKFELGLLAAKYDAVPEPAGIDADLALAGLDGEHAGRRIDALRAPFGGLRGVDRKSGGYGTQSEQGAAHSNGPYNLTPRRRNALPTTLTDDKAIAAAAMIGDSSSPNAG